MLLEVALSVAIAILVAHWLGARRGPPPEGDSLGTVGASLLALLGLILAFSFSAAWGRYHQRLDLAIDEANAIGTLDLRLDLLPAKAKRAAESRLLEYVRERIAFNHDLAKGGNTQLADTRHRMVAAALWSDVFEGPLELRDPPDRALIVQSLNETLDLAAKRRVQSRTHIPLTIAIVLALTSVFSAYVIGHDLAGKSPAARRVGWAFLICVSATVFTVFDLENPRVGLISIRHADALLHDAEVDLEAQLR